MSIFYNSIEFLMMHWYTFEKRKKSILIFKNSLIYKEADFQVLETYHTLFPVYNFCAPTVNAEIFVGD